MHKPWPEATAAGDFCARAAAFAYNRGVPFSLLRRDGLRLRARRIRRRLMPFALLLALAATAGATALTYLYDGEALLWSRLCAGVCLGFAVLGLAGFVLASWLGMTPAALLFAGAFSASPLLLVVSVTRMSAFQLKSDHSP